MPKNYKRDYYSSKRFLKKTMPKSHYLDDRTETQDELNDFWSTPVRCPFCGLELTPYKDMGAGCFWRCWTTGCPNNPDDKIRWKDGPTNYNRIIRMPTPRRII